MAANSSRAMASRGWGGGPSNMRKDASYPQPGQRQQQNMYPAPNAHLAAMQNLQQHATQLGNAHQAQQTANITPNVNPSTVAGSNLQGPNVTQGAYEGYQGNQQSYNLQSQAEDRRLGMLGPLMDKYFGSQSSSSSSSSSGAPPPVQIDLGSINGFEDAARSSAMARAQDTAGQTGRAAMNSLSDIMGARGMSGSGLHMADASGIISEGARGVGEAARTQQIDALDNARKRASDAYFGGITQRGQDMQFSQARDARNEAKSARNAAALQQLIAQITARY